MSGRTGKGKLTADYEECGEGVGFCGHGETSPGEQRGAGRPSGVDGFALARYDGLFCLLVLDITQLVPRLERMMTVFWWQQYSKSRLRHDACMAD